jgi:hypothetical protein
MDNDAKERALEEYCRDHYSQPEDTPSGEQKAVLWGYDAGYTNAIAEFRIKAIDAVMDSPAAPGGGIILSDIFAALERVEKEMKQRG